MHGSICLIVEKFVIKNYGLESWDRILESSGVPGLVISPIQTYDDKVVFKIVESASEMLSLPQDDVLEAVGRFAGPELIHFAQALVHPEWTTFELFSNVESLIHKTIRMGDKTVRPAHLQSLTLDDSTMQMVYSSKRGLCSLAKGIMLGISDHYGETISIFHNSCTKEGDACCVFTVEKPSSAKNNSRQTVNRQPNVTIADPTAGDLSPEKASQSIDYTAAHQGQSFEVNESESITPTSPRAKQSRTIEHLPEKVGRYRIYGQLGSGGSGLVYKAYDESLGRNVALKTTLNNENNGVRLAFLDEARRLARLKHPNVIGIYDIGHFELRPYLVMEYLTGTSLRDLLDGGIAFKHAVHYFSQLLDGLNAVHRIGMVHRDIKPENIIVNTSENVCQILDFGLACEQINTHEFSNTVSGTMGYIPPEVIKGLPYDYRSDFFSMGCVAYEMFSGRMITNIKEISGFKDSDYPLGDMVTSKIQNVKDVALKNVTFSTDDMVSTQEWLSAPSSLKDAIRGMIHHQPAKRLARHAAISKICKDLIANSH